MEKSKEKENNNHEKEDKMVDELVKYLIVRKKIRCFIVMDKEGKVFYSLPEDSRDVATFLFKVKNWATAFERMEQKFVINSLRNHDWFNTFGQSEKDKSYIG